MHSWEQKMSLLFTQSGISFVSPQILGCSWLKLYFVQLRAVFWDGGEFEGFLLKQEEEDLDTYPKYNWENQ